MSAKRDQREFFREVERDYWASAAGLKPEEEALIERALDPGRRTLEAGTGGGRIVRALRERGFSSLAGFDYAPELIEAARAGDPEGAIEFAVADATSLPYADEEFEQAIYLQQIVCTIEERDARARALAEAARVLRPGGVALFSFLLLEGRRRSPLQGAFVAYLSALRRLRRRRPEPQLMPRLRLRGRPNPAALRDAGPYVYWYRAEEAVRELEGAGLTVRELASGPGVLAGSFQRSAAQLVREGRLDQTLYVVCERR